MDCFIMENPIELGDLGISSFMETSISVISHEEHEV